MKHTGANYKDVNPHADQNNLFHIFLWHSVILFYFFPLGETVGGTMKPHKFRELFV